MSNQERSEVRAFISAALEKRGDTKSFSDNESLFLSGRLDSFNMVNLVMFLEKTYGINFDSIDFEVDIVDTIEMVMTLIASR